MTPRSRYAGRSRTAFALVLCTTIGISSRELAQDRPAGDLARDAEQRIRELQTEVDRLAAQASTLLGELRKLELERAIKAEAARKADAELAQVTAALKTSAARVERLEAERTATSAGVRERLVEIYKRGRSGYVRLLFASDDLRALGRMSRAVAAVARLDRVRFDEHRRIIRAERAASAELDTRKTSLSAAQAEARKARAAVEAAVAAHNRRIDDLDQRRDVAAQYVGELQTAATELGRRVDAMASTTPAALPLEPFRGALEWPVAGAVVSRFGRGTSRLGTVVARNGVEISAAEGREVRAVHGGTVTFAAPFMGYGTLVIIDHGGNDFTVYGHLQHALVAEGTRVDRGAVVGRAGRNPDGAEVVYFEVRVDGRPVDPVQWLRSERR